MLTEALILCGVPRLANKVKFYICYFVLFPPSFWSYHNSSHPRLADFFPPPELVEERGLARPVVAGIVATICFLAAAVLFSTMAACFVNKQRRRKLKRKRGEGEVLDDISTLSLPLSSSSNINWVCFVVVTESCLNCSLMLLYLTHLLSALNARSNRKHPFNCLTSNIS